MTDFEKFEEPMMQTIKPGGGAPGIAYLHQLEALIPKIVLSGRWETMEPRW